MPLQLLPMNELDMDSYEDICWTALKGDIMGLFYPEGYSSAAKQHAIRAELQEWRAHPDRVKIMKVVDPELPDSDSCGKIISVAKWRLYTSDRSVEEVTREEEELDEEGPGPDTHIPLREDFFGGVAKRKEQFVGNKAHAYLHILATRPGHQRRGAAAMQMQWGLEKADELGLPSYLESTAAGQRLYERVGYQAVGKLPFDAWKWGHDRDLLHTCMLRPAKGNTEM